MPDPILARIDKFTLAAPITKILAQKIADSKLIRIVKELSEKHEVFIVSAATEFPNSLKEKYDWMKEYFPFISWRNFVLCGDKSIVSGDIMIDDHEKNLIHFNGEKILYDAQHNKLVKGYLRLNNWIEIHNYFFK